MRQNMYVFVRLATSQPRYSQISFLSPTEASVGSQKIAKMPLCGQYIAPKISCALAISVAAAISLFMPITSQHTQEILNRAYVLAIAGKAGVNISMGSFLDYGTDAQVTDVMEVTLGDGRKKMEENGSPLKLQLKSTINCRIFDNFVSYDCSPDAYNKLIRQNTKAVIPMLLIVFCMPDDAEDWLTVTQESLILRKACYWYYLTGEPTKQTSQVIRIPRSQLFTPEELQDIMRKINNGEQLANGELP